MTQTISRMYSSPDHGLAAVEELRKYRVYEDRVHIVLPPAAPADDAAGGSSFDSIVAAITDDYVLRSRARIYAEGIRRGGTLVTVHAQWGSAVLATEILDRFAPIDSGVPEPEPSRAMLWDEAAPLSSGLQMPVFYRNPTPFSAFWNLPVLTAGRASLSALLGIPELTREPPRSRRIASSSRNPAPLSNLLRIPTLRRDGAPLSALLSFPLLAKRPAPLSALLTFPVLSSNPAPLSALLRLPVLTRS